MCCGVFFSVEKRRRYFLVRLAAALAVCFGLIYLLSCFEYGGDFNYIINFLIMFAMLMGINAFCFEVKLKDVVFDCAGGYALEHSIYCILTIITYYFPAPPLLKNDLFLRYLCLHLPVTVPVAAIAYFFLVRPVEKRGLLKDKDVSCVFLSVIVLFSAVILNEFARIKMGNAINPFTTRVVCKLYSLLCCMLVLFLQLVVFRWKKSERDKELVEYILEQKKAQYKFSRETVDLINMKYHDLKHQIRALRTMQTGDREEAIKALEEDIKLYDGIVRTGNESLDVILTENSLLCLKRKIQFSYSVKAEALSVMEPVDIYSLFGNALDNAINSVYEEEESKRIISLKVYTQNDLLFINIENYCGKELVFRNGLPVTGGDKKYHGYGTKSIEFIVKKYGGHMRMSLNDNMFSLGIVLPLGKDA